VQRDATTFDAVVASGPVAAVEADPAAALGNPVPISVVCHVEVWDWSAGTHQSYATPPATGLAVAAVPPTPVTLAATETAVIAVCTEARLTDAHGVTRSYAQSPSNGMWYPYTGGCEAGACLSVDENCNYELALLASVERRADTLACPLLAGAAPGVPGTVDVDPAGDTSVAGEPFWDCPPYGG
jgi:hypothetical protein